MPTILSQTNKKTEQVKHLIILPKEMINKYVYTKGDRLVLKSMVGNEITFTYERAK